MPQSLEDKLVATLKKKNRISLLESVQLMYGGDIWNFATLIAGISAISSAAFLAATISDGVVADENLVNVLEVAQKSMEKLSGSIGDTLAGTPSTEQVMTAQNDYAEVMTHLEHATRVSDNNTIEEIVEKLAAESDQFSGQGNGQQAIGLLHEVQPDITTVMEEKSGEIGKLFFWAYLSACASLLINMGTYETVTKKGRNYQQLNQEIQKNNTKINDELPKILEGLNEFPTSNLIYSITLQYLRETGNVTLALDFLAESTTKADIAVRKYEELGGNSVFKFDKKGKKGITRDQLFEVIKSVMPEAKPVDPTPKLTTFNEIGGYAELKEELQLLAELVINPKDAEAQGVKPETGLILYGPPGTGKTIIAEAMIAYALRELGEDAKKHYEVITAAEIKRGLYGESEAQVARLFARARANAPFFILVDEGDSLLGERGDSAAQHIDAQVTNQFLVEIGGVKRGEGVFTIITSNREEAIDTAASRYGRLGVKKLVGLPDANARYSILEKHLSIMGRQDLLDKDLEYNRIVNATEGFTGADIAGAVGRVFWTRYGRIKLQEEEPYKITTEHLVEAANQYKTTVKETRAVGFMVDKSESTTP